MLSDIGCLKSNIGGEISSHPYVVAPLTYKQEATAKLFDWLPVVATMPPLIKW